MPWFELSVILSFFYVKIFFIILMCFFVNMMLFYVWVVVDMMGIYFINDPDGYWVEICPAE